MERLPTFGEALRVWLRIGLLSFGGPAAQIAVMHREIVEQRKWVSEARFQHALAYCMLLPGPEAMQLVTYLGWLMHRTSGALAAGLLFVLPGAACMLALAWIYAAYHQVPSVAAVFWGLAPAVVALVAGAVWRLGRKALIRPARIVVALAALGSLLAGAPFPVVILVAAVTGLALPQWFATPAGSLAADRDGLIDRLIEAGSLPHVQPHWPTAARRLVFWLALWFAPVGLLSWLAPATIFPALAWFFSLLAGVTFGGAYAALAWVAQGAVQTHGWVTQADMIVALGLAETTPGPLILVLQFVGFLAGWNHPAGLAPAWAGIFGAAIALWCTFVPCFLYILVGAPWVERLQQVPRLAGALAAIGSAVVGVIAGLGGWFAWHVCTDPAAAVLAALAGIALLGFRLPLLAVLGACAAVGAIWRVNFA